MQQPDSPGQHSSAFLLHGVTQLQQQTGVVLFIHCSLGRQIISSNHLLSQKMVAMSFTAEGKVLNILGGGDEACLYCIDSILLS